MLGRVFKCAAALILALSCLCGCGRRITEYPIESVPETASLASASSAYSAANEKITLPESGEPLSVGELYGSFLTMYRGHVPADVRGIPCFRVLRSYSDVENFYDSTEREHIYARHFTDAMLSFTDEFFSDNDVLVLTIDEPSSYVNHTAGPIRIYPDRVSFDITRHTPESSPLLNTEYNLIFTAPAGSFSGIDALPPEINITEVVDGENNSAFDADMFRLFSPEYTSFCYRADTLDDSSEKVVDAIDGYEELVYFYDKYRDRFDLDKEFKDNIGTLYSWDICERYVLVAVLIPCSGEEEPKISEIFVNNLQIYVTVNAAEPDEGEKPDSCYLLLCGIERRDLAGVDLGVVYLSVDEG